MVMTPEEAAEIASGTHGEAEVWQATPSPAEAEAEAGAGAGDVPEVVSEPEPEPEGEPEVVVRGDDGPAAEPPSPEEFGVDT